MSNPGEAKEIIRNIRKSRHADDPGGIKGDANARSLSRALDMLSEQLYNTPTHFILELIQNADDNTYASGVDPCLTLAYREDGYLWVGCNELGFSEANVEAICEVADSTKKVEDSMKGYIGEKGIGFKSVFKVADHVWISSGHFTFRFDRDELLGMVVPIWSNFPGTAKVSARTMFCLRILNSEDRQTVKSHLLELRAELLLFLRKLMKIEVKIYGADGRETFYDYSVRCRHENRDVGKISILTRNRFTPVITEEIFTLRFTLENMPFEQTRKGIPTTEIALGFPTSLASRKNRSTYNFLPIRSYGLSFLLQADFVLTANRGDIVEANQWNLHLVGGAITFFVESVTVFNRTGICKYDWPQFLRAENSANGTIIENLIPQLRTNLKHLEVLENQAGAYAQPSSLVLVPDHFTDGGTPPRPLLGELDNLRTYVSTLYTPADLRLLGLTYQTVANFQGILSSKSSRWIQMQGAAWHSRLAAGIVHVGFSAFRNIKLIPLRDGRWSSANEGPVYFPSTGGNINVPEGIELNIIEETACGDRSRCEMFTRFGAKTITENEICNLILDRHRSLNVLTYTLTLDCLIYHAWYLYSFGRTYLDYSSLKLVADRNSNLGVGQELYMDLPDCSFHMRDYFGPDGPCKFLHSDYLAYAPASHRPSWHTWLQHTAGVSTFPKLLNTRSFQGTTTEFQYLIDKFHSKVWLTLLKNHWSHYHSNASRISGTLGSLRVDCTGGRKCKLRDSYLATSAVMREPLAGEHISLIEVPNPEHRGWLHICALGLRAAPDLNFYLSILLSIASSPPETFTETTLIRLYKGVERHFEEDPGTVKYVPQLPNPDLARSDSYRAAFSRHKLIGLVSSHPRRWLSLAECRWQAPSCLETVIPLESHFSQISVTFKILFKTKLEVANAGPADVLDELLGLPLVNRSEKRVKDLLLALSRCHRLGQSTLEERFRKLAQSLLMPVRLSPERTDFRGGTSGDWFIADRQRYSKCFAGKVWFFDFDEKQISSLGPVIQQLGLTERRLSSHVREETITNGESAFHHEVSHDLQSKAGYISLLVSPADRESALCRLRNVQIWSSTSLVLRRYVVVNNEQIFGKDEVGRVVLEETGNLLRIYCSAESIVRNALPWPFIHERLSVFFDIPLDRQHILSSILTTSDHDEIKDFLERKNLLIEAYSNDALHDQGRTDSELDTDEESNFEGHGDGRASRTPTRQLYSTPSSNFVNNTRMTSPPTFRNGYTPSSSVARRVSPRLEPQIINVDSILQAADAHNSDGVHVLGPSVNQSARVGAEDLLRSSGPSIGTPHSRRSVRNSRSPDRADDNGPSPSRSPFNMSTMRGALPILNNIGSQDSAYPRAGDREKEIGYGGELYIYKLLQRMFGAGETCWTSKMRSRYGLSTFAPAEGGHADFTISEPEVVPRITNWLMERGFERASEWFGRDITYHLEVKTTLGDLTEPFMVSNNQVNLARRWHEHVLHVYIILRVYHLTSNPSFKAYVDPFALMISGELIFTAQGGYYVQPARA